MKYKSILGLHLTLRARFVQICQYNVVENGLSTHTYTYLDIVAIRIILGLDWIGIRNIQI